MRKGKSLPLETLQAYESSFMWPEEFSNRIIMVRFDTPIKVESGDCTVIEWDALTLD